MRILIALSLLVPALVTAQRSGIQGPTPGYLFDAETRELRPLRGFPGAAYLADALIADADAAAVSADGTLAVALRKGAVELIRDFDSGSPASSPLGELEGDVLFSWSGHNLAAVSESSRKAYIWRNLDTSAEPAESRDLAEIAGDMTSLTFDGSNLVIAAKGGIYRSTADSTTRLLDLADPTAPALLGADLFVADRATGGVWQITGYAGDAAPVWFAEAASPVGVQVSRRGLLVASAETHSVDRYDLLSKARVGSVELEFTPAAFSGLGNANLSLLSSSSPEDPLFILDSGDTLQVFFVPAGRQQ